MARPFMYTTDDKTRLLVHLWEDHLLGNNIAGGPGIYAGTIVTASAATVWQDPNSSASSVFEVFFNIVNQDTANAVVVTVGFDPLSSTALASPNIVYNAQSIAAKAESGWQGPWYVNGKHYLNASADVTNRASLFVRTIKWNHTVPS